MTRILCFAYRAVISRKDDNSLEAKHNRSDIQLDENLRISNIDKVYIVIMKIPYEVIKKYQKILEKLHKVLEH